MLRVAKLSGEEVASIEVEEVSDVRSLKQRLSQLHGLPPRFRQRLLLNGRQLEDAAELDSPTDLQLVLLPFAEVSQREVDEFRDAARRGSVSEAEILISRERRLKPCGPVRRIPFKRLESSLHDNPSDALKAPLTLEPLYQYIG